MNQPETCFQFGRVGGGGWSAQQIQTHNWHCVLVYRCVSKLFKFHVNFTHFGYGYMAHSIVNDFCHWCCYLSNEMCRTVHCFNQNKLCTNARFDIHTHYTHTLAQPKPKHRPPQPSTIGHCMKFKAKVLFPCTHTYLYDWSDYFDGYVTIQKGGNEYNVVAHNCAELCVCSYDVRSGAVDDSLKNFCQNESK